MSQKRKHKKMARSILRHLFLVVALIPFALVSCDDEYQDTKDAGEAYIKSVSDNDIYTLNTGLKYKKYFEEDPSWPDVPSMPGFININYTAMFINGDTLASDSAKYKTYQIVESISSSGDTTWKDTTVLVKPTFYYSNMIDGCKQAIKRMKVGSKWRLWIPYNLAYGSDGIDDGTIKVDPYTALIYDIELIGVSAE
ncbi:MAG: hypothetical protein E7073_08900 [Bacteroidales bacterium]|nr:hypothetical protein [Bacteroidales bacterium]